MITTLSPLASLPNYEGIPKSQHRHSMRVSSTTSYGPLLSKRVLFTAVSTFCILVYLVLWRSDNGITSSLSSSSLVKEAENFYEVPDEYVAICNSSFQDARSWPKTDPDLPVVYFVTPTYTRAVQQAELIRLGQTLIQIPGLHWILAEDAKTCSPVVRKLLRRFGLPYTHMATPMPSIFKGNTYVPRGVAARRAALQWIRDNVAGNGVLFFGDDDNTYDLRLFDEIRSTRYVSMFPVGLVGEYAVSAPVVRDGKVVGFYDSWLAGRRFPVDMAGFAVHVDLLHQNPNATMPYKSGYEEDDFLRSLNLNLDQIEAKASNCSEILVWHTKTVQVLPASLKWPVSDGQITSIESLLTHMNELRIINLNKRGKASNVTYLLPTAMPKEQTVS